MIVPRKTEPDPAKRELRIVWSDGHRSAIPFQTLREHCPCAKCRSQRDAGKKLLIMALSTKYLGSRKLGNYAIQFDWGDSHSDGIFAFDYLRELCACGECGAGDATPPEV